ncbi:serine/threonine-protein kinase [Nocardia sp. NPDC058705]|uniref:serine/threonine-protein kinase n=1 Tax=Nocardia sp. NPDC058705 TaxID=3346609 RepID=UPI0036C1A4EA
MEPLTAEDPDRLGRYQMLAVIGRGGMGQVLLGRAPDGRLIAVKQIHRNLTGSPEFRARFHREVVASQQVTGAYTAGVVDADADAESPWLASEYIAGPSLQEAVTRYGAFTPGALKLLLTGLAMALLEIHRTGLVHRDLKPSNVLLTNDGPRVIDFGIARAMEDDVALTATGAVIGSPAYMSPEQAECRPLTAASDVFSLGVILAMAATGASPFQGTSTPQILYNVLYTTPDTRAVPEPFRAVVDACLAKDPAQRPTPDQLLEAAGRMAVEPVWPSRVRRRIAEYTEESISWADGTARTVPVAAAESTSRRFAPARIAMVAGVVAALVLTAAFAWGTGVPGEAIPMADPPLALTAAESRLLDPCALLAPDVIGEVGKHSGVVKTSTFGCATTLAESSGRSVDVDLDFYVGADDKPALGTAIGWMPVLGSHKEARLCGRSVVTQSGTPLSISVNTSTDKGDTCPVAERVLAAVVRRLSVNPPLKDLPADSAFRIDPCGILDRKVNLEALGDPAKSETVNAHLCTVSGGDWFMNFGFSEKTRPDQIGGKTKETREIGGRTVYVDDIVDGVEWRCYLDVMVRPSSTTKAEVLSIDVHSWGLVKREGACARATLVLESVLAKLPPS